MVMPPDGPAAAVVSSGLFDELLWSNDDAVEFADDVFPEPPNIALSSGLFFNMLTFTRLLLQTVTAGKVIVRLVASETLTVTS
jgi:hypothetical protein